MKLEKELIEINEKIGRHEKAQHDIRVENMNLNLKLKEISEKTDELTSQISLLEIENRLHGIYSEDLELLKDEKEQLIKHSELINSKIDINHRTADHLEDKEKGMPFLEYRKNVILLTQENKVLQGLINSIDNNLLAELKKYLAKVYEQAEICYEFAESFTLKFDSYNTNPCRELHKLSNFKSLQILNLPDNTVKGGVNLLELQEIDAFLMLLQNHIDYSSKKINK